MYAVGHIYFASFKILFVFGFQQFNYNVSRCESLLSISCLVFAELLSVASYLSKVFNHYFFQIEFLSLSLSPLLLGLIMHILLHLTVSYRSHGFCSFFFFLLLRMGNLRLIKLATISSAFSNLLLHPSSAVLISVIVLFYSIICFFYNYFFIDILSYETVLFWFPLVLLIVSYRS